MASLSNHERQKCNIVNVDCIEKAGQLLILCFVSLLLIPDLVLQRQEGIGQFAEVVLFHVG